MSGTGKILSVATAGCITLWLIAFLAPVQYGIYLVAGGATLLLFIGLTMVLAVTRNQQQSHEEIVLKAEAGRTLLANMSHEIRTPLNGILGMTELALDTDLSSEQREYLSTVQFSAESLLRLINDLLDSSRIEAGKLELEEANFDLRDSINDTLKTLASRAQQKGLELVSRIDSTIPDGLRGDVHRLRQVLVNLVGNAIKFTAEGTITVNLTRSGGDTRQVQVNFEVTDSGIGIPQATLPTIFEPFAQADVSVTRKYGGTGLGLAISRDLVELLGGELTVESEVGRGTTFRFSLAFARGERGALSGRRTVMGLMPTATIMVVDRNSSNRESLVEMLDFWKLHPVAVESAAAAFAMLDTLRNTGRSVSVVIADVDLPDMRIAEFCEQLQQHPIHGGTRIQLMGPTTRVAELQKCKSRNVVGHLLKPIKQTQLFQMLLKVLANLDDVIIDAPPTSSRSEAAPSLPSLQVLVVDDQEVNRRFAQRVLQKHKATITTAENGKEAIAACRDNRFDVILMDVQMPVLDGISAARMIHEEESGGNAKTPIIAMTAHTFTENESECRAAGMDGFLTKPVKSVDLVREIRRLVETSEPSSTRSIPALPQIETVSAASAAGSPAELHIQSLPISAESPASSGHEQFRTFEQAELFAELDNDAEFLMENVRLLKEDAPQRLAEIKVAIRDDDPEILRTAAHTLRGLLTNFRATESVETARTLESLGKIGDTSRAAEVYKTLDQQIGILQEELSLFCSSLPLDSQAGRQ